MKKNTILALFLILFFSPQLSLAFPALIDENGEVNKEGWIIPDLKKGTYVAEKNISRTDAIPGDETRTVLYHDQQNGRYATFEINNKIYAIGYGKDKKGKWDHTFVDNDGDGKFELKYPASKEFDPPSWVTSNGR